MAARLAAIPIEGQTAEDVAAAVVAAFHDASTPRKAAKSQARHEESAEDVLGGRCR